MTSTHRPLLALAATAATAASLATTASAQWPVDPRSDLVLGNRISGVSRILSAGVAIDEARGKLYVSSASEHRIMRFSLAALAATSDTVINAEAILGQPDTWTTTFGNTAAKLNNPGALAVEPATGRLWVADRGNGRILRYDKAATKTTGSAADGVFGDGDMAGGSSSFYLGGGIQGLACDALGNLYASVSNHHAVYRFTNAAAKPNGAAPDVAFGQVTVGSTYSGTSATTLNSPYGLCVTGANGTTLWVVDKGNNRVLRFDNAHQTVNTPSGIAAAAVIGQPDMNTGTAGSAMSRLDEPTTIAASGTSLFVSDGGNYRTLRYNTQNPAPNVSAVAWLRHFNGTVTGHGSMAFQTSANRLFAGAGNGIERYESADTLIGNVNADSFFGSDPRIMTEPTDVAIDPVSGKVFVTDSGQNRGVARFSSYAALVNGAKPEAWVCRVQPDVSAHAGGGLVSASGLCFDAQGRLWVADYDSASVYRYDNPSTMPASTVASSYLGGSPGKGANQMYQPMDVYADPQGRVWVADTGNNRVLRFDNAASKPIGASANAVLGQPAFGLDTVPASPTLANMHHPGGIVGDGKGAIWVADTQHHRVLRFDNAAAKANGASANAVLGQNSGTTAFGNLGATGLDTPRQLAVENGAHLWVSEAGNKRVVRFKNAATLPNGGAADTVIGQPDFFHTDVQDDLSSFVKPNGIAIDPSGRLFVADTTPYRVMRFSPNGTQIVAQGLTPQKQLWLTYKSNAGAQYDIESSVDLSLWNYEATQTAIGTQTTYTSPSPINGRRFYRVRVK